MPNVPTPDNIGKIQNLIIKNPLAFVASVFFISTFVTYFLFVRQTKSAEQYWRELYLKERGEKDMLKDELLYKSGIIERQDQIIKESDSTLRDNTIDKVEMIQKKLNYE